MPQNKLCIDRLPTRQDSCFNQINISTLRTAVLCAGLLCLPVIGFSAGFEEQDELKELGMIGGRAAATATRPSAPPGASGGGCTVDSVATPGTQGCQPPAPEAKWVEPSKVSAFRPAPKAKGKATAKSKTVTTSLIGNEAKEESAGSSKLMPGDVLPAPMVILPETTTTVKLSASDLNRIICPSDVKEALTSDEKGLMIKISGKDVFLKYKVGKRSDGTLSYSATPTEVFVVCGGSTYTMIAFPSRLPSQTIKLSSGKEDKLKENQAMYAGLPFEKRVMRVIKEVFTDAIPETYLVTNKNEVDLSWKGLIISHLRDVVVEGEGMTVKEYNVSLKPGGNKLFHLTEKMFLRKDFTTNPIGVAVDKHTLLAGETARVFIVEQKADKPLGGNGLQLGLPTVEGGSVGSSKPASVGSVRAAATMPGGLK